MNTIKRAPRRAAQLDALLDGVRERLAVEAVR